MFGSHRSPRRLCAAATLALGVFGAARPTRLCAQTPARGGSTKSQNSVAAVRRATVTVLVRGRAGGSFGTGFIVAQNGVVVTAAHVVSDAQAISLRLPSGQTLDVYGVLHRDDRLDFAVLKVDAVGLPTVPLGDSDSLQVGQRLMAIGAPEGLELTVADGLLSSVRNDGNRRLLQISIPVSHGSSGGPVISESGKAVGLVVSGLRGNGAENLNFALPINYVRELLPLISNREPTPVGAGGAVAVAARARAPRSPSVPAVVNDSLRLDWAALDGVEIQTESRVRPGVVAASTVRYTMAPDPSGKPTIERQQSSTYKTTVGFSMVDQFNDDTRSVLYLGAAGRSEVFFKRSGYRPDVTGFESRLTLEDTVATLELNGRQLASNWSPKGALPNTLADAAIAALPDSLPRTLFIWVASIDSTGTTPMAMRLQFRNRRELRVSFARPGESCGPRTRMELRKVEVVAVSKTVGAATEEFEVLAARPHLRIDSQASGCISIPQRSSGAAP